MSLITKFLDTVMGKKTNKELMKLIKDALNVITELTEEELNSKESQVKIIIFILIR
jgi:hypothetical protein